MRERIVDRAIGLAIAAVQAAVVLLVVLLPVAILALSGLWRRRRRLRRFES